MKCRFIIKQHSIGMQNDIKAYLPFFKDYKISQRYDKDNDFYDINFYIESPVSAFINNAKINILMSNYEFMIRKSEQGKDIELLHKIDYVLCKTKITYKYCAYLKKLHKYKYKMIYTKHNTPFKYHNVQKDTVNWLHGAGVSHLKQTDAVLKTWKLHPEWPELLVVCRDRCIKNKFVEEIDIRDCKNIKIVPFIKDLNLAQQKYLHHICPSLVEGYGHYINEARAASAFVITTNYPPMNELITSKTGILVDCTSIIDKDPEMKNGVKYCIVGEKDLEKAIEKAMEMSLEKKILMGKKAHQDYVKDTEFFIKIMKAFVKELKTKIP